MEIRFVKYKDVQTGEKTVLNATSEVEVANAIINILTNRRKGFPRTVTHSPTESEPWVEIETRITQEKPRIKKTVIVDDSLQ